MADPVAEQQPDEHLPAYVRTDADRTRWANAGKVARDLLADRATDDAVWSMTRTIYHDRDSYPD